MAVERTVADLLSDRQEEVLDNWFEAVKAATGPRGRELRPDNELKTEVAALLSTLTSAFSAESYDSIDSPEFAASVEMLQEISAARARQGSSPTETATFVLSLKNSLLVFMQEEFNSPETLNSEIIKMNNIIDMLALVTFETFANERERVVQAQSRSILELSTPAVEIWDEILLVPLVGVIDTPRAQQFVENLLETIVETESRVAILDVTGVPVIDTSVARHILKATMAAHMLGARILITGISPEMAQTWTKLDLSSADLHTKGSLRAGLREAFAIVGKRVADQER